MISVGHDVIHQTDVDQTSNCISGSKSEFSFALDLFLSVTPSVVSQNPTVYSTDPTDQTVVRK